VAGNAWQWWDNAAGRYARGSQPEPGSVLSFSANGRMRLGHVAVVARVVNAREIEVDQANWWGPGMRGGVSRGMPVVDVSENNDWTAVRVGLGRSGEFGSVYPTNGFIYDRPDNGQMVAAVSAPAPKPALNPAPADLRPWAQRADYSQGFDEVAEAPAPRAHDRLRAALTPSGGFLVLVVVADQAQRAAPDAALTGGVDQRFLPPMRDPDFGCGHLVERGVQLVPVGMVGDHQRQFHAA
jgi:hypothetical protein